MWTLVIAIMLGGQARVTELSLAFTEASCEAAKVKVLAEMRPKPLGGDVLATCLKK